MSRENEASVRQAQDAFSRRDRAAFLALCDPDIENVPPVMLHAYFSDVLGATFKGYEGLRAYIREITDSFEAFHIDIDTIEGREGESLGRRSRGNGTGNRRGPRTC